ncbi:MAG TPA: hypothetical protein PLA68_13635 [Panacibacter sp.]|nr:hypothetical protein [Panacibacter sp.]
MTITEYKESIKQIVDTTDNEKLLKFWKLQLEHDIKNGIELDDTEWEFMQADPGDLGNAKVISLEEFVSKK